MRPLSWQSRLLNITGEFGVISIYLKFLDRNASNAGQGLNPWKDGTILVKRMIEKYAKKLRRIEDVEGLTVFIDTNPAFSVTFFLHIFFQSRQYSWHAPLEKTLMILFLFYIQISRHTLSSLSQLQIDWSSHSMQVKAVNVKKEKDLRLISCQELFSLSSSLLHYHYQDIKIDWRLL